MNRRFINATRRACANPRCTHTMPAGRVVCAVCWQAVPIRLRVDLNRASRAHGTPAHRAAVRAVLKSLGAELQHEEAA